MIRAVYAILIIAIVLALTLPPDGLFYPVVLIGLAFIGWLEAMVTDRYAIKEVIWVVTDPNTATPNTMEVEAESYYAAIGKVTEDVHGMYAQVKGGPELIME